MFYISINPNNNVCVIHVLSYNNPQASTPNICVILLLNITTSYMLNFWPKDFIQIQCCMGCGWIQANNGCLSPFPIVFHYIYYYCIEIVMECVCYIFQPNKICRKSLFTQNQKPTKQKEKLKHNISLNLIVFRYLCDYAASRIGFYHFIPSCLSFFFVDFIWNMAIRIQREHVLTCISLF